MEFGNVIIKGMQIKGNFKPCCNSIYLHLKYVHLNIIQLVYNRVINGHPIYNCNVIKYHSNVHVMFYAMFQSNTVHISYSVLFSFE